MPSRVEVAQLVGEVLEGLDGPAERARFDIGADPREDLEQLVERLDLQDPHGRAA
jgi:hypothetical protein